MRGLPPPRPTPAGAEMADAKRPGMFAVCPSRLVPGPAAVDAAPAEMLWWVQLNPEWERGAAQLNYPGVDLNVRQTLECIVRLS